MLREESSTSPRTSAMMHLSHERRRRLTHAAMAQVAMPATKSNRPTLWTEAYDGKFNHHNEEPQGFCVLVRLLRLSLTTLNHRNIIGLSGSSSNIMSYNVMPGCVQHPNARPWPGPHAHRPALLAMAAGLRENVIRHIRQFSTAVVAHWHCQST